jgi:hypothetical protein
VTVVSVSSRSIRVRIRARSSTSCSTPSVLSSCSRTISSPGFSANARTCRV